MPNWCEADLRVSGPKKDVEEFERVARGSPTSAVSEAALLKATVFVPLPEGHDVVVCEKCGHSEPEPSDWSQPPFAGRACPVEGCGGTRRDWFNRGGHEWCVKNWGTKWGICNAEETDRVESEDELTVCYTFNTAWSPASPVIAAMGKRFPMLRFEMRYFESGNGFNGLYVVEKAEVAADETGDYFGDRGG